MNRHFTTDNYSLSSSRAADYLTEAMWLINQYTSIRSLYLRTITSYQRIHVIESRGKQQLYPIDRCILKRHNAFSGISTSILRMKNGRRIRNHGAYPERALPPNEKRTLRRISSRRKRRQTPLTYV